MQNDNSSIPDCVLNQEKLKKKQVMKLCSLFEHYVINKLK